MLVSGHALPHVITSAIEHPAVIGYLYRLRDLGVLSLDVIGVNHEGFIDVNAVVASLTVHTALVTVMHSNNEVGTIQPIREISKAVKQYNATNKCEIIVHVDAAQSLGKVPVDVQALQVDMMTVVGHKLGAPKGVAVLYINDKIT